MKKICIGIAILKIIFFINVGIWLYQSPTYNISLCLYYKIINSKEFKDEVNDHISFEIPKDYFCPKKSNILNLNVNWCM